MSIGVAPLNNDFNLNENGRWVKLDRSPNLRLECDTRNFTDAFSNRISHDRCVTYDGHGELVIHTTSAGINVGECKFPSPESVSLVPHVAKVG